MIIEFETTVGMTYQIDMDDKTYRRWFADQGEKHVHIKDTFGKLVKVPKVEVGQPVDLLHRGWDNSVIEMRTSKVVKMRMYERMNPEDAPDDGAVSN